jgi:perosamine synthetase
MIPLAIPNLCGNEARYLQECVSTGFVSSVGGFVTRFEELVACSAGTAGAVATSAGTTGLHLALMTVGVRPGDLVIAPSFSFIATANAVAHCGAKPWLFDIRADDWCLDADLLVDTLRRETAGTPAGLIHLPSGRRVGAVMPVYANGYIPLGFRSLATEFGLPLVADAAPAIGALRDGQYAGAFADLTVFSFNGNKTVTSGGGGAIVGHDTALIARARHRSSTARVGADYHHDEVGYNYRMTNLEAAVGCAQMENLAAFVAAKRHIRDRYRTAFDGHAGVSFFPDSPGRENACWFSGLILPADGRIPFGPLAAKLNAAGVQCRPFWKPIHLQPPYRDTPRSAMPVCEALWERIVVLPSSTQLTDADQATVIAAVQAAL